MKHETRTNRGSLDPVLQTEQELAAGWQRVRRYKSALGRRCESGGMSGTTARRRSADAQGRYHRDAYLAREEAKYKSRRN